MSKEFEMSIFSEINFFIGFQVHQIKGAIYVTQSNYINEILKTFGMDESRLVGTPMITRCKLSKEETTTEVNGIRQRSMIDKLHYVVHNRSNIVHAIGIIEIFSSNPKEIHMTLVNSVRK